MLSGICARITEYAAVSSGPSGVSASCYGRSENVRVHPVVIAELELSDVQRQVFGADVVISANDAALQDRPEALNRVRVDRADNVFASAMPNDAMREFAMQMPVAAMLVGGDQADLGRDSLADEAVQGVRIGASDDASHDIALALHGTDHGSLALRAIRAGRATSPTGAAALVLVPVAVLAADVGLIDFHKTHQLCEFFVNEGRANLVAHVQSGLVGTEAHVTLYLQGADALLAGEHQMDDAKPLAQRFICVLEDRPSDHGEAVGRAFAAVHALPLEWHRLELVDLHGAAAGAADATRPAVRGEVGFAGVVIREHRLKLADGHLVNLGAFSHLNALFPTVRTIL